jgi:DNA-binding MarR family transcriptional regulator
MQSDGQTLDEAVGKDVIAEIGSTCLLLRMRLISRIIESIYEKKLQPFGIGAAQFASLVVIYKIQPATRAEIGRLLHQDRSTLTRNLRALLRQGWVKEIQYQTDARSRPDGRRRPIVLTTAGKDLLLRAEPAWQSAQAQAKNLIGKTGVIAAKEIANRVMDPAHLLFGP